jgi:hypothetical protein
MASDMVSPFSANTVSALFFRSGSIRVRTSADLGSQVPLV